MYSPLTEGSDSVRDLKRWHKSGNVEATYMLGVKAYKGDGIEQDFAKAAKYFRQASIKGYARASFSLGLQYRNGKGVDQSDETAMVLFRKAALKGLPIAKQYLGIALIKEQASEEDIAEGERWISESYRESDSYQGALELAKYYYDLNKMVLARIWHERADERGSSEAKYMMAIFLLEGIGGEKDTNLGWKKLSEGSAEQHPKSMYVRSERLIRGLDISKSVDEGLALGFSLIENDEVTAELRIKVKKMLLKYVPSEILLKKDALQKFESWGEDLLKTKDISLIKQYGLLHLFQIKNHRSEIANIEKAIKDLRTAAEGGEPEAAYWLGELFKDGIGVSIDLEEARTWYQIAETHGYSDSKEKIESLTLIIAEKAAFEEQLLSTNEVFKIQNILKELGYLSGLSDGVLGNNTLKALEEMFSDVQIADEDRQTDPEQILHAISQAILVPNEQSKTCRKLVGSIQNNKSEVCFDVVWLK